MSFGSIGGEFYFSNAQFSQCGFVCDTFNHKLPLYVSPVPDNHALAVDALSVNWNFLHAYAFPPSILIPSILAKIRHSQCRIVLVAPFWPQRPWFSEVLQLLVSASVCLPLFPQKLTSDQKSGKSDVTQVTA